MSPQPDQNVQLLALVKAQAATRESLNKQAVAMAVAMTQAFDGWYDTEQITVWASKLSTQIESFQRVMAQSTDAYLARVLSLMTGSRVKPVGRVDVSGLRLGVTHPGVYGRAADVYRYQQAQLDAYARSLVTVEDPLPARLVSPTEAALERATAAAEMDVQLADRAQSQRVMTDQHDKGIVTGYRRVIHPEASKGGTCGLCIVASDRLYHAKDLMPIHNHCECTTLPVIGEADPGSSLNRSDLDRLYKEAGGTAAAKLKATRYQLDENGELGPMLNPAGTKVRTARRARADANQARTAKTEAERLATVQRVRESLTPALTKAQALADGDPKQWGSYLDQVQARVADLDSQLAAQIAA